MAAIAGKSLAIMDVNPEAVLEALRRQGARRLIHGHTHRPGDHALSLDGQTAHRLVLAEWREGQGEALLVSSGGWRRLALGSAPCAG
jgi:UDP-2,3-diacylglucosamine hydrolase